MAHENPQRPRDGPPLGPSRVGEASATSNGEPRPTQQEAPPVTFELWESTNAARDAAADSLIFLPFISSAFVPTATMPGPVRAFAEHQPVTMIVNAIRGLFTQQPVGTDVWIALVWCAGIFLVAYYCAMATYRRKIS